MVQDKRCFYVKKNGEILSKKVTRILIIFIVLICVVFFGAFLKIENTKTEYEKRVTSYLVDEKGYDKKDIKSVDGIYGVKLPPYYVVVIFEDEPYVRYIYFAHAEVIQFDYILTNKAIEMNINKSKLKNYDPLSEIDKYIIE
ncbi:hypothetical protein AM499_04425 [Bacillus sp. FJAT-22090]|uniref:DUF3139 domain-containing protein n=1 Tax=Bacillus sp. FJAT-22090 TaxID=1581038 RepID=UPI0006AFBB83|nr:DUF3139 domain-containing protein [Bacillus sp. FJAT-22090]ALC85143.1 hypothetical protein AM499_04425 [Bacillus sp. FJAT-22090]